MRQPAANSLLAMLVSSLLLACAGSRDASILTRGVVAPDGSYRPVVDRYELKPIGK